MKLNEIIIVQKKGKPCTFIAKETPAKVGDHVVDHTEDTTAEVYYIETEEQLEEINKTKYLVLIPYILLNK